MFSYVGIATAFGAGVLSFVLPCTLALVPAYMAYLASFTLVEAGAGGPTRTTTLGATRTALIANVILFALGFTAVFVALGASLGALSQLLIASGASLNRVSGVFLIALGLVTMGLVRLPFLERDYKLRLRPSQNLRYAGSFLVGATFALGRTPCVGPILGAIFVLAGTSGSVGQGALLLAAYSAGLMLPFVAAGITTSWTSALLRRHGRWLDMATTRWRASFSSS